MDGCQSAEANSDKSEVIWVGSTRTLQKQPGPEVTVGTTALVLFRHLTKSNSSELESLLT